MISALLPGRRCGRATPSLRNAQAATEAPSTGRGSIYRNRNGVSTKPATSVSRMPPRFSSDASASPAGSRLRFLGKGRGVPHGIIDTRNLCGYHYLETGGNE